jgi:uroporphyrin-3 C-methyltransferase
MVEKTTSESTSSDEVSTQASSDTPHFEPVKVDMMKNTKAPRRTGIFLSFILLLLVLTSLGASAFLWQRLQHVSSDIVKGSIYKLDNQAQQQSIKALQESLFKAQNELIESQKNLQILSSDQKQLKAKIAGISGVNRVDWLVDELLHLSRLAHQRLVLSHDAKGAIALLKAADQVVVEMRQSSALAVRQAIAADLLNLRLAADVDLEGAYIRLDSLSNKIEELTFKKPSYPSQSAIHLNEKQTNEIAYMNGDFEDKVSGAFSHIIEKLQPYLYRSFRIDTNVKPLLSGDERQYLSRNMVLAIEEAQLALLRREPESYRLSLEQSEQWIQQYYNSNDPLTTSVLTIIEELKSYRLDPKMPEIDKTLQAVKVFSENWQEEKVNKSQLRRSLSQ